MHALRWLTAASHPLVPVMTDHESTTTTLCSIMPPRRYDRGHKCIVTVVLCDKTAILDAPDENVAPFCGAHVYHMPTLSSVFAVILCTSFIELVPADTGLLLKSFLVPLYRPTYIISQVDGYSHIQLCFKRLQYHCVPLYCSTPDACHNYTFRSVTDIQLVEHQTAVVLKTQRWSYNFNFQFSESLSR